MLFKMISRVISSRLHSDPNSWWEVQTGSDGSNLLGNSWSTLYLFVLFILWLRWWGRIPSYILFLVFPRNNISSNENTISSSDMFVYRRPFPISLTISRYLGRHLSLYIRPCSGALLKYLRMQRTTLQWSMRGACLNWLITSTVKDRTSLIIVR